MNKDELREFATESQFYLLAPEEDVDTIVRETAQYVANRLRAERDALRKRIADAPKASVWHLSGDERYLDVSHVPASMTGPRVALVVLGDDDVK